jgi:hypothetical protein
MKQKEMFIMRGQCSEESLHACIDVITEVTLKRPKLNEDLEMKDAIEPESLGQRYDLGCI